MVEKLYYPYINVQDEDFLKYALLCYDRLHIIVPRSKQINEKMHRVEVSTDLLVKIDPELTYDVCYDATRYTEAFIENRMQKDPNFMEYTTKHTSRLYRGKFSYEFEQFCRERRLVTEGNRCVKMHPALAYEYMTNLANVIAAKYKMDIVTDNGKYANPYFSVSQRNLWEAINRDVVIQQQISSILPTDLRNIPIERIIALRNQPDCRALRQAFQHYTDVYIADGKENSLVLTEIGRINKEIASFYSKLGFDVVKGVMSTLQFADCVTNMGVTGFAIGAIGMAASWHDVVRDLDKECTTKVADVIATRKYLGKIKKLPYIEYENMN